MKFLVMTTVALFYCPPAISQPVDESLFLGTVLHEPLSIQGNAFEGILKPIDKSKYTIELRFQVYPSSGVVNGVVLYYDNRWNATRYRFAKGSTKFESDVVRSDDLGRFVQKLIAENIFCIRDQHDLKLNSDVINLQNGKIETQIAGVTDGTMYILEYKVGDKYRAYSYNNAEGFSCVYKHIDDLRHFANIVKMFRELE